MLILPVNDSISATLDTDHVKIQLYLTKQYVQTIYFNLDYFKFQLHAKTTVMTSSTFKEDRIWLNGK